MSDLEPYVWKALTQRVMSCERRMDITERDIDGIYEIQLEPKCDPRGFFMRVYDREVFDEHDIDHNWVQDSHSLSRKRGTVRGLHFQFPPGVETKLVRVINGKIFDVYLDLRRGSKSFGAWGSIELSAANKKIVYIPRGFAHGFCTLTEDVEILYRIDNYYDPDLGGVIRWDSPSLGIPWPHDEPHLSKRDANANTFSDFVEEHGSIDV